MIPRRILIAALVLLIPPVLTCDDNPSDGGKVVLPEIGDYVVFAWNDLGMHCLNPTYDQAVILPPYNTVWAQVVRRGDPPQIVTAGLTAEYRILGNTYSYGKRSYGQFWDNVTLLFGTDLAHDTGLNLDDPGVHNGLSGAMAAKTDHFVASGIPVTPVDDADEWNPYQVAEITIKDDGGNVVARTRATVPTSDDINCTRCHGATPFQDVLAKHDAAHATTLVADAPVLCAGCHASPALGGTSAEGNYLSKVIHQSHASRDAACYDCHPGPIMACNRSQGHTAADGNCALCHGDMANVGGTIAAGTRIPWVNEPKCVSCHVGITEVETGLVLYRNASGHGDLYCAACHSSPHAMIPSTQASDNYQAMQYQGKAVTIGSCGACHSGSRGESDEIEEFAEKHGGSNPEQMTACNICHTAVSSSTPSWPHAYHWTNR
jgi:hypothetical protein